MLLDAMYFFQSFCSICLLQLRVDLDWAWSVGQPIHRGSLEIFRSGKQCDYTLYRCWITFEPWLKKTRAANSVLLSFDSRNVCNLLFKEVQRKPKFKCPSNAGAVSADLRTRLDDALLVSMSKQKYAKSALCKSFWWISMHESLFMAGVSSLRLVRAIGTGSASIQCARDLAEIYDSDIIRTDMFVCCASHAPKLAFF